MADIRYVIVSDLHFGAENSVMTSLTESTATATDIGFAADPITPSPLLQGLVEVLRELTKGQARPPTLVMAGDILDLALSPDGVTSTAFSGFARLAFSDGRPLFDPVVYYVPGNHDHHLWETAREERYVQYLATVPAGEAVGAPRHVTGLHPDDEKPPVDSAWLTNLIKREPGGAAIEVRVAYPNMALTAAHSDRAVVVTHGHFIDSIYSAMSELRDILFPGQHPSVFDDIELWEEENFAWIDFLWSTLGRSGEVGNDLGLVYADLSSTADVDALVANLTRALLAKGKSNSRLHALETAIIYSIFKHEVNHVALTERGDPTVTLSVKGRTGLLTYLRGPVLTQLRRELGEPPKDLTFVFGHTHKPFVDRWTVNGYPTPVRLINTGGWVVDTVGPAPVQGAVVVLASEDLDLVALQLYRQSDGPEPAPVQVLPAATGDDGPNELRAELAARIDPRSDLWGALTAEAATLTAQRHRLQAAIVRPAATSVLTRPGWQARLRRLRARRAGD